MLIEKIDYKFNEFHKDEKNKSSLYKALYACSCKFTASLFYAQKSIGPILIFSNYVKMEGLQIFHSRHARQSR
jgi:hypothetical protein